MSLPTPLIVGLVWLLHGAAALAQEWSVDLYDIKIDDPTVDRVRADSIEFLPDGKHLVSAGWTYDGKNKKTTGELRLYDAATGTVSARTEGRALYQLSGAAAAISPSGEYIAAPGITPDNKWVVDVFSLAPLKHLRTLNGKVDGFPGRVSISPDDSLLAVTFNEGTVQLWDYRAGEMKKTFKNETDAWPVAWSPDGLRLAIGFGRGVSFRNREGEAIGELLATPEMEVFSLQFSPDGKRLAAGGLVSSDPDCPVIVWRLDFSGVETKVLEKQVFLGHRAWMGGATYSVAFSPDGQYLASSNQDKTVRIWELGMERHLAPIVAHTDFVYDVAFSPDGERLATLGRDSLKMWSFADLRMSADRRDEEEEKKF